MLKSNFKIFLIFILIFNLFTTTSLAATTKEAYNQEELMQYPGYGKAMYETILEETTFITGQYTDNKEFVNKSIVQIRDYGKFWWNEQNWESEAWTYDRFKEMVAKPTGYLLTVGDWVKKLFTGYGEKYHPPEVIQEIYDFTPYVKSVTNRFETYGTDNESVRVVMELDVIQKFEMTWKGRNGYPESYLFGAGNKVELVMNVSSTWYGFSNSNEVKSRAYVSLINTAVIPYSWANHGINENAYVFDETYFDREQANRERLNFVQNTIRAEYASKSGDVNDTLNSFIRDVNRGPSNNLKANVAKTPGGVKPNPYDKFKENVDTKVSKMATPQPRPFLSCPNGTKIEMSISGSTFLGIDGKAMIVNKDGTAQVDSAICNLGWDKPEVKYIDDRPAIQTPDNGWQDAETGQIIVPGNSDNGGMQCVENGVVVPCNDIEKPDGSLLAYVKNAYEYATSLIDTAVNGLKQLSSGAVGMIELYKIYMSWLPTEIQTVMYSGLAIMIGLRVFRK